MISKRIFGVLAASLVLVIGSGGGARAQDASAGAAVNIGQHRMSSREQGDSRTLNRAMEAFQGSGYAGLRRHTAALRRALDRAPESYAMIEQRSPTEWVVRSDNPTDGLMLSLIASTAAQQDAPGKSVTIDMAPNVYPMMALVLGSDAVERRSFDEAIGYLDRGLALQPDNHLLSAEKMAALQAMGRNEEALAVGEAALEQSSLPLVNATAALRRRMGYSLIELSRLDEAKASYEAALDLSPGHPGAQAQLDYIAELQAGGAVRQGTLIYATPATN